MCAPTYVCTHVLRGLACDENVTSTFNVEIVCISLELLY